MAGDPVLHLLAGPNGSGKSTLYEKVIEPVTGLEFVNADRIAKAIWPSEPEARSYDAAAIAAQLRDARLAVGTSFCYETLFSHGSKLDVVGDAMARGYIVELHVVVVPVALSVARVKLRAAAGGHDVPEPTIRQRYDRLWPLIARAIGVVTRAYVYDNTSAASPYRRLATFEHGQVVGTADWTPWTPPPLVGLGC